MGNHIPWAVEKQKKYRSKNWEGLQQEKGRLYPAIKFPNTSEGITPQRGTDDNLTFAGAVPFY